MTAISTRSAEIEAQVEAYRAALLATGMYAGRPVGSVARAWLKRVGFAGWARLDLVQQCATPLSERRLVSWLMVIGQLHPSPEYLIFGRPYLGEVAARHHRPFYVASVPPPLRSVSIGDPPFCSGQRPSKWRPCSVELRTRSRRRSWSPVVMR